MRARTSRKKRIFAPLHTRGKFLHSHLSKELREKMKKRSIRARKGDKVKIVRGSFKGKEGRIVKVDLKKCKIFVEGVTRKKARGQEILVPIDPSNVIITELSERK